MIKEENISKITEACHVSNLHIWLENDLYLFKLFLKELNIPKIKNKQFINLYYLGIISYNAIDSIADGESDPKDLNLFLSMLLEYKISFNNLSRQTNKIHWLEKFDDSINRQYLKCANEPLTISLYKIQGIRSVPYIAPFILALLSSPDYINHQYYREIIKCCFCFCSIRQTSDDLKDLDDDIKNNRITFPTIIFNWQREKILNDSTKFIISNKSLEFCKEKMSEISKINMTINESNTAKKPVKLIITQWHDISTKIIYSIEKYNKSLSK